MRIRVPSRISSVGCLVALLWLLPTATPVANARPIGPDPWGNNPTQPKGDTDGVVLARAFVHGQTVIIGAATGKITAVQNRNDLLSSVRTVYRVGGLRGLLAVLHLPGEWLGLR